MTFVGGFAIREARVGEVGRLRDIEASAGALFRQLGMDLVADDEPAPAEVLQEYVVAGRAFVAVIDSDLLAGYLLVDRLDGAAHVEQVSVDPAFGRRRIGAALLERAALWASEHALRRVTLNTFDLVPWNRPYYERCGYRPLSGHELTPGLVRLRAREAELGLDAWPRLCMARDL
jgi:GNAT superfamily N-acetyltransferase